jgi:hypothetical protein
MYGKILKVNMPKISASKGRPDDNSGYARLFGNQQLGQLMSRVQATVIRSGNELEKLIESETPNELKASLEEILTGQISFSEVQVVFQAKMPPQVNVRGGTADIVIFNHREKTAKIIEVKDGDTFDTKKASGELASMEIFAKWLSSRIDYKTTFYFCSFNQINKEAIVHGAKGRFDISHAMTGQELCNLLNINYDALRIKRQREQPENLRYFISELLRITEVKQIITELLEKIK